MTSQEDQQSEPLERCEGLTVYRKGQVRIPDKVPEPMRRHGNLLDVVVEGPGYTIPIMDVEVTSDQCITVPDRQQRAYPIEQGDKVALVIDEVSQYAE